MAWIWFEARATHSRKIFDDAEIAIHEAMHRIGYLPSQSLPELLADIDSGRSGLDKNGLDEKRIRVWFWSVGKKEMALYSHRYARWLVHTRQGLTQP
jgi:hypothetical protein